MKKKTSIFFVFLISFVLQGLSQRSGLSFAHTTIDLGDVYEYNNPEITFSFSNQSKNPFHFLPTYNTRELEIHLPRGNFFENQQGSLSIKYYTEEKGKFKKDIPVYINTAKEPIILRIEGNIKSFSKSAFITCPNLDAKPTIIETPNTLVEGMVIDAKTNVGIKEAQISLALRSKRVVETTSSKGGLFKLEDITPNKYQLLVQAPGYETFLKDVIIENPSTFLQVKLIPLNKNTDAVSSAVERIKTEVSEQIKTSNPTVDKTTETPRKITVTEIPKKDTPTYVIKVQPKDTILKIEKTIVRDTIVKNNILVKTDTIHQEKIISKTDTIFKEKIVAKVDTVIQEKQITKTDTVIKTITIKDTSDNQQKVALEKQMSAMQQQLDALKKQLEEKNTPAAQTPVKDTISAISEFDKNGKLSTQKYKKINVVFLVDVSLSMADEGKLTLMKKSIKRLTNVLRNTDTLSLISYNISPKIVLQRISPDEKTKIEKAVDSLSPFGLTYGVKGIEKAYAFLNSNKHNDEINLIIMATDGMFSSTKENESELFSYVNMQAKLGNKLSVVGLGKDKDAFRRMRKLAENGAGSFIPVENTQLVLENFLIEELKRIAAK